MADSTLINGAQLKYMLIAGSSWLRVHISQINASNVFPVPDGDTGTNMSLTLQAALKDVQDYPGSHAGQLAALASQGALMGARGNSGVILSQMLEGFSEALKDKEAFSVPEFALALQLASNRAYKAVMNPVEGTILTVIKETALIAQQLARHTTQIADFLAELLVAAKHILNATPDMLPALKEAGVVDSGGQGLVFFLEGMARYTQGLPTEITSAPAEAQPASLKNIAPHFSNPAYPYDVQFLIKGQGLNLAAIRQNIARMGDCPLVVGDSTTARVHVHVADPGVPLSYAISQGSLQDIVVENMQAQYQALLQAKTKDTTGKDVPAIEVICVANGPGLEDVFKGLGATAVLAGGASNNISVETFLKAIEQADAGQIMLLPNHKDVLMAAQQASRLAEKNVQVIPSLSVPQGISALLAFSASAELAENNQRMKRALAQVQSIEIARAVRDTVFNGLNITKNDFVALLNGELTASGPDTAQLSLDILAHLPVHSFELLTVYFGKDIASETANDLLAQIQQKYPHLELDLINGGQPYYQYIISVE